MLISFVVPAYNASDTIRKTLISIFNCEIENDWAIEVIVVDDGSTDRKSLIDAVSGYEVKLISHSKNQGMCAARNTGIAASKGHLVIILDSDDEMVENWPLILRHILVEIPNSINLIFALCKNLQGKVTAEDPDYQGLLTLEDLLNERRSGEYLPVFRGPYIRSKLYIDLKTRKSCGIVSYLNFAADGPFWITRRILRVYHDSRVGSVSHSWTSPRKAAETIECYKNLFRIYGDLYRQKAPRVYCSKMLRLAIYHRFARLPGAWRYWLRGASLSCYRETFGSAIILCMNPWLGQKMAQTIKRMGWIRRYG